MTAMDRPDAKNIEALLKSMGQLLNNAALYGPTHNLTRKAVNETHQQLAGVFRERDRLNLSLVDGEILVDGQPTGTGIPFISIVGAKLEQLGITGFTLHRDMPKEEFGKFIGILLSGLEQEGQRREFADIIEQLGMKYIEAERVTYQRVSESDRVVSTEKLQDYEQRASAAESALLEHVIEDSETTGGSTVHVDQIMAFLKGSVESDAVAEELTEVAKDANQLAQLIMEAAVIRQQASSLDAGESLGDLVVGCLRRTFEGLKKAPAAQTPDGRKSLKKTLVMLEKTVLEKLQSFSAKHDPALDEMIASATEEMADEIELNELAAEYMRHRRAMENNEKRMMRYIRKHDAQEVENRMYDAGMTPHGWRELLVKSRQETAEDFAAGTAAAGTGTGGTGGSGGSDLPGGIGALAVLLAELDDMMAGEDISPEKVDDTVTEIGKEVERIAEATEQKIEALGVDLEGMMVGEEEYLQTHHAMPQHEFRDLLAEIVQELCQPLSAANCAVNMTLGGHVGEINDKQQDVLAVASRCGKRLDKLLERLKQIVGMPKGLKPDKERVYSKPPKPITPLVQIFDLTPEDEEA